MLLAVAPLHPLAYVYMAPCPQAANARGCTIYALSLVDGLKGVALTKIIKI